MGPDDHIAQFDTFEDNVSDAYYTALTTFREHHPNAFVSGVTFTNGDSFDQHVVVIHYQEPK